MRDIIIVGFYHKKLIVSVLLASLVLAVAGWGESPVRYTAKVQLLVLFGREQSAAQGLDAPSVVSVDGVRATASEVNFLQDRAVLRRVVEQVDPTRIAPTLGQRRLFGLMPPIAPDKRLEAAVDRVEEWLKVSAPPDSNLVEVSYAHPDRDVAIEVIDTLVNTYLQRRAEVYSNPHSPYLRERAKLYAQKLGEIETAIRDEKAKLNVLNLDQEILLALNQVDSTSQTRQQQMARHEAIAAEIEATEKVLQTLPSRTFDFQEKTDRVDNDDTDNALSKLYVERDSLREQYRDDEPRLQAVNRQIATLEERRRQPRRVFTNRREVRNPAGDFVTNHLSQMRVEYEALGRSLDELGRQLEDNQRRVDALRAGEQTLRGLERSRQMTEQLYKEASQRAESAEIEEASNAVKTANIRIVDRADASLAGTSNGLNVALGCLIGGLILAAAGTVLAAWNRRVLLMPQEVETALGLPLLASYNAGQSFTSAGAQAQTIFLAGQMVFNRQDRQGALKVQVVSPADSEQRSDFIEVLAAEVAQGQGMRTLLIDLAGGAARRWTAFGEPVVRPDSPGGLGVAATSIGNLDVSLDAGSGTVNWLRANGKSFESLFDTLSGDYDLILIAAPPAKDSLVPLRLANTVDGSILVIRAEHTRVLTAHHLCEQLLNAGGNLFGAVVTGRKFHIPKAIFRWL